MKSIAVAVGIILAAYGYAGHRAASTAGAIASVQSERMAQVEAASQP